MTNTSAAVMDQRSGIVNLISWAFGIVVLAVGLINTFWGNDTFFGLFLIMLAFVYFPPITTVVKKWVGISIPLLVKIILGIFIIWASLGVGELFDKIDLMMVDFK